MKLLALLFLILICGCKTTSVIDPSPEATASGDLTLLLSACENIPARGMDLCRVKEGATIASVWRLILPIDQKTFIGGEIDVYFKDKSYTQAITGPLVEIPWRTLSGQDKWTTDLDGEAEALALIRFKDANGIEQIWRARGIAKVIVTKVGYDPLPIDSGFVAWGTDCKFQYSTAGRSAVSCK